MSRWFVNWSLLKFASVLVLAVGPRHPDVSTITGFYSDLDLTSDHHGVLQGGQALTHILHLPSTINHRTAMLCRRVLENESDQKYRNILCMQLFVLGIIYTIVYLSLSNQVLHNM